MIFIIIAFNLSHVHTYVFEIIHMKKEDCPFCLDFSPDSAVIASKQTELDNAYNETAMLSASRKEKLQVRLRYNNIS